MYLLQFLSCYYIISIVSACPKGRYNEKKTLFHHHVRNARDLHSSSSCNRLPRIRYFRLAYGHRPVISAVRHGYEHHYSNLKSKISISRFSRLSKELSLSTGTISALTVTLISVTTSRMPTNA